MGLRLQLLYWWTPSYVIQRELRNLSEQTTDALKSLLAVYAPQQKNLRIQPPESNSVKEQRANMAQTHVEMVEALAAAVGHDKAVELGRESLFAIGVALGRQTRSKLGVGENPNDLIKASKILYRTLGIDFHIEWLDQTNAIAVIERCALSKQYSKLTCEVLSATDEGVIQGLQPNVTMKFTQYLTGGCQYCKASLNFKQTENTQ
ncbi:MAG TPA: L-2-amino-thiazoline-4-carboxylic acid hydrolase [Candidatus Acidoferrales bacterium]|nr:L-2-amino-thiazoline-4-carboxylic acid hydrolase [Candidatus Acidoferrales bacterium]